jgi:hypothetical protein
MTQNYGGRGVSLVFPVMLIAIGGLFLLHNYRPAFDPMPILWTYWPLILIFIGLGKIWDSVARSRNPNTPPRVSVGASVGAVAFVVVLGVLMWHGRSFSRSHEVFAGTRHVTRVVEPQRVKTAQAKLEMGAGELTIDSGAKDFLDADFTYSDSYNEPKVDYSVSDGVGNLRVSQDSNGPHFGHSENDWKLKFSKEIPLELRLEMGAGQGNLHFQEIPLTRLNLRLGAGQMDIDLTGERKNDLTADIQGGVGEANIRLPKNIGVIAHASGGIGSIEFTGMRKDNGAYVNDAYGKSPVTIRLRVEGGIGQINMRVEP